MKFSLWKPYGITSNYFIDELKQTNNYKKICYAGRLDPLAQGQMLILTDDDVKTMELNLHHNKIYQFDLILGISTSSCDIAGDIIDEQNITNIDSSYIQNIHHKLVEFINNYNTQYYPLISGYVVKHEIFGRKPLWWFAKNNINVNIPSKNINIFDYRIFNIDTIKVAELYETAIDRLETITNNKTIDDLNINQYIKVYRDKLNDLDISTQTNIIISMELSVSSGFYIRQFCSDFGKSINIPAIAFDITRTKIF